jgi:hypothetical protein
METPNCDAVSNVFKALLFAQFPVQGNFFKILEINSYE